MSRLLAWLLKPFNARMAVLLAERNDALERAFARQVECDLLKYQHKELQRRHGELLQAIQNHRNVKGRFHTEQATMRMYALYEQFNEGQP